jgi:DNA-binding NtrC family response regulator
MHTPTIVVIDTDASHRELIIQILADEPYCIVGYGQSASADAVREHRPDLIIIDVPPIMSEPMLSLLDTLCRDEANLKTALMISSTDHQSLRRIDSRLGRERTYTLAKPFSIDYFLNCVDAALNTSLAVAAP